ncbi:MAG: NUDIX hydrolase [Candidatus Gracilibacteria bacterium]|nr:NUDIX hydrolase [Candidatus Gracilibacteria bacterium]
MRQVTRTFLRNNEGKYLMVRHNKKDYWTLPGGHIEEGEDIYKAIKREIKEELNLEIKILGNKIGFEIENIKEKPAPICIYKIDFLNGNGKNIKKIEYIFLSEIKSGEIKIQDEEIAEYRFFSKDEVLNLDSTFLQIKEILKRI